MHDIHWRQLLLHRPIKRSVYWIVIFTIVLVGGSIVVGYQWIGGGTPPPPVDLTVRITIPEGLRSDQIAMMLEQKGIVSAKNFLSIVRFPPDSLVQQFPFIDTRPTDQGLEGFIFGDTYDFFLHSKREQVVARFLEAFERKIVRKFYPATNGQTPPSNLYSQLILASIVEKEIDSSADRKIVADIFRKRMASGIPLQADSTINFITGRSDARARAEDLLIASPYNTYRNRGLPPGPISNPSADAMDAVIYPTSNAYYYFLTDSNGVSYYARTWEEHQSNRRKFLK